MRLRLLVLLAAIVQAAAFNARPWVNAPAQRRHAVSRLPPAAMKRREPPSITNKPIAQGIFALIAAQLLLPTAFLVGPSLLPTAPSPADVIKKEAAAKAQAEAKAEA